MLKLKSAIVIILSSLLISAVIMLTIGGLTAYFGWKESEAVRDHREKISGLNSKLYSKYISIQNLEAVYEKGGIYKGKCLLEGHIKNNGYRTVSSVRVALEFPNAAGGIIHVEDFLPLKASIPPQTRNATIAALSLFTSGKELPLLPGGSIRFKHLLSERKDKNITSPIKNKKYSTNPNEWSGKFDYKITAIKF